MTETTKPTPALTRATRSVGRLPSASDGYSIFLDVDGTLLDIATGPEAVIVPPDLPRQLVRVGQQAGGALALVSGRSIDTLDRLFGPARIVTIGLHGAEQRGPDGQLTVLPPPPLLQLYRQQLKQLAQRFPGATIEDKGAAIAVHYRANPSAEASIRYEVDAMATASEGTLAAQRGKMVIELKPAGAGKGGGVKKMMEQPPFRDKTPLAIGDDITDEDMFAVVNALGGKTFRVGVPDRSSLAQFQIESPGEVRAWLASLSGQAASGPI